MYFYECNPFMRYSRILDSASFAGESVAYDMRLFGCKKGSCNICVGGSEFVLDANSVLFWQSGILYNVTECTNDLEILACNFDFTQKHNGVIVPVGPAKPAKFAEKQLLDNTDFCDTDAFSSCIFAENALDIMKDLREIYDEYSLQKKYHAQTCSAILKHTLSLLARYRETDSTAKISNSVEKIMDYIRHHYKENITNEKLGEVFSYHPNYINRLMVRYTGMSLHQYVIRCRISSAIQMLSETDKAVSQIADETGFSDLAHFTNTFRRMTGKRPSDFRPKE